MPPADRHRLAQVDRERDHLAGAKVAAPPVIPSRSRHRRHRRRRGVDLQRAGRVGHRAGRLAALPAPSVTVAPFRLTAVTVRSAVFWPAADRVAEGQRAGAGAAGIGRRAAVVERQRRRAAGMYRHRLAHGDRQRHRSCRH